MGAPDVNVLAIWERGDRQRASQRVLAMLRGTEPELPADALLALRRALYGEHFAASTTCPTCSEAIEVEFDLDDVAREATGAAEPLTAEGIVFRLPTAGDLIAIETAPDAAAARDALLRRCIIDAQRPVGDDLAAVIAERMAGADPQADITLPVGCPSCGDGWREPFDIASFLWIEIAAAARRLLQVVHRLASSYGWSEQQILALTPSRRHAYLEMLPWPTS